jgi:hypothetical protein
VRHQRLLDQRRGTLDARHLAGLVQHLLPVVEPSAVALDDRVAIEADDLVEQFGAKAVHHAHHDDQRGHAQHHRNRLMPATSAMNASPRPGSM